MQCPRLPSLTFPTRTESLDISSSCGQFRLQFSHWVHGYEKQARLDLLFLKLGVSFHKWGGGRKGEFTEKKAFTKPNPLANSPTCKYSACITPPCQMSEIHKHQEYHRTPYAFSGQIWARAACLCFHILFPRVWEHSRANSRGLRKECLEDREVSLCCKPNPSAPKKDS